MRITGIRAAVLLIGICSPLDRLALAQPAITSWHLNTTGETGTYTLQNGTKGTLPANVQTVQYDASFVYVSATGIPSYDIGPFGGNPNVPANQQYVAAFPRNPAVPSTKTATQLGAIGLFINGVAMFDADDGNSWKSSTATETPQGDGIWHRNGGTVEAVGFDPCDGHPQQQGAYHHHGYSPCLGAQLGTTSMSHSTIFGFAFDGYPIYGPYGYSSPASAASGVRRIVSGYRLRSITQRHTLPNGTALTPSQYGPDVDTLHFPGRYLEDFEWIESPGDLDEHNGRFCVTPDYPNGTYAYFLTIDGNGEAAYPYTIGLTYYGSPNAANFRGPRASVPATGVTVLPVLTISGFASAVGAAGSSVVITGKGFTGTKAVYLNEIAMSTFTVDSDTQITATLPASAATGRIRVDRAGAAVRSTIDFQVIPGGLRRRAVGPR